MHGLHNRDRVNVMSLKMQAWSTMKIMAICHKKKRQSAHGSDGTASRGGSEARRGKRCSTLIPVIIAICSLRRMSLSSRAIWSCPVRFLKCSPTVYTENGRISSHLYYLDVTPTILGYVKMSTFHRKSPIEKELTRGIYIWVMILRALKNSAHGNA